MAGAGPATAPEHPLRSEPGLESRLLLLCCRPRRDGAALEAALARGPDWTRLVAQALRHQVTPQLALALDALPAALVPAAIAEALRSYVEANRARSAELGRELLAILDALADKGIPAIPFKGPTLAQLVCGDPGLRVAGDLDFLIALEQLERVREVLAARGFVDEHELRSGQPLEPAQEAWVRKSQGQQLLVRERDALLVEPHWLLAPDTLAVAFDYAGLWRRARPLPFAGRPVASFALEDLLLVLCVHGSKHQWTSLRWVADVAELVARHALDWSACLNRAAEQGCARMLALGLGLAHGLLEAPLPDAVSTWCASDRTARALARETARHLFDPGYRPPSVVRISRYRLRMRERAGDRLRYLLRTGLTPSMLHLKLVSLPAPLRFLYYPLKLTVDLLALPVRGRRRGG